MCCRCCYKIITLLWGAQFLSYAGYCSLCSCRLGRVVWRGSSMWLGMMQGLLSFLRVGGVCRVMGTLRVYPVAVAGGKLLCKVWFFPLWNIPD
jgi:hypothetical protein